MSVVSRLLSRSFKCAVHGTLQDGALRTEQMPGHQFLRSSCHRFFSNQTKPTPPPTGGSKPEPQKAQTPPPPATQKPQTPQTPTPQKPATPGATPVKVPAPNAQAKPGVPKVVSTLPGQKLQTSTPTQKPGVAVRAPATAAGAGVGAQKAQAHAASGDGGSSPAKAGGSGGQSKLKVFLASGVVGGLVMGLLYWQSPNLHDDGLSIIRDKGKDDASDSHLPDEAHSGNRDQDQDQDQVKVEVAEPELDLGPDVQQQPEETVVEIFLEPERVKVETSAPESGGVEAEKQEHNPPENRTEPGTHTDTERFTARIEPEPGSSLEKVIIEFEPLESDPPNEEPNQEAQDIVVQIVHEPEELSTNFLLQRGHEEAVKEHDPLVDEQEKLIPGLRIVDAIHAAEHRQAERDAAVFSEQLQQLEDKHRHDLSSMEQRASSFHEQVVRLQEDMEKERHRHDESLKQQQEQAEAELQQRVKLLEEATERQVEEAQLLAKAEAANVVTQERANFLSDIGRVKIHIEAMSIALDAKSEEVRDSQEIRQLSLGSFAFEDALASGAPVDKEAAMILNSTGGDPLVDVTVQSLPKEVLTQGTLTPAQLEKRLEEIETSLRELALIPASGGGVLCHLIARLATLLKLPDHGVYEEDDVGVDAVMAQVQDLIRGGQLVEAADKISRGLSGTNAEELAEEWASQTRNRAILEQAAALLRAHSATLALRHESNTTQQFPQF